MLANIWCVKEDWDNEWNQWKHITFYELDVESMDDLAVDFINKIRDMPKDVRQWGIYEFMKNKLELFRNTMPLITDLRDESMRQRHWNDVRFEVKEEFNEQSDEFTLEKVFELELVKHADMISELAHNAKK
jgi:dynein heavy chain